MRTHTCTHKHTHTHTLACLKAFHKRPQQGADALAATQQLDQPHHAEEPEKVDGDDVGAGAQLAVDDVDEAAQHDDKVERVPPVKRKRTR